MPDRLTCQVYLSVRLHLSLHRNGWYLVAGLCGVTVTSHGNAIHITGGESSGGFPMLRANNTIDSPRKGLIHYRFWRFHCCLPEQTIEQTVEVPVLWDATTLLWRHCNDCSGLNGPSLKIKIFLGIRISVITCIKIGGGETVFILIRGVLIPIRHLYIETAA